MARTKQTARKSVDRKTPPVSDDDSSSEQGEKRAREVEEPDPKHQPPLKRRALGADPLLRNDIHWRIHSITSLVTKRFPAMATNSELMDRAIERAKHQLLDEIEAMQIDEQ